MRKFNLLLALCVAGPTGGNACAMERPRADLVRCAVIGADKLPAEAGGGDAICTAIRAAAREKAPGAAFAVEVRVESASTLAALVSLEYDRTLPELRMAVSDRHLNPGSIERFAAAIAGAVAGNAGQ